MAIDVALRHSTAYRYDQPVQLGPQVIRLRPAPHCRTRVLSYSLTVVPKLHFLNWQQDLQGNYLARFVFPERTREFVIDVDLVAEMAVFNPFDFFLEPEAETFPFTYAPWLTKELAPYLTALPAGPLLAEWLASVRRARRRAPSPSSPSTIACSRRSAMSSAWNLASRPARRRSPRGAAPAATPAGCWSRSFATWVSPPVSSSGYLIQLKPDVKPLEGPAGAEQDFTDLHAWTECLSTGRGDGSASIPPPGSWRARGTRRSPARPTRKARRRSAVASMRPASSFSFEMSIQRSARRRASPSRTRTSSGIASSSSAIGWTRSCARATYGPSAASRRLSRSTTWTGRNGTAPPTAQRSAGWRRS